MFTPYYQSRLNHVCEFCLVIYSPFRNDVSLIYFSWNKLFYELQLYKYVHNVITYVLHFTKHFFVSFSIANPVYMIHFYENGLLSILSIFSVVDAIYSERLQKIRSLKLIFEIKEDEDYEKYWTSIYMCIYIYVLFN